MLRMASSGHCRKSKEGTIKSPYWPTAISPFTPSSDENHALPFEYRCRASSRDRREAGGWISTPPQVFPDTIQYKDNQGLKDETRVPSVPKPTGIFLASIFLIGGADLAASGP
eukprot:Mycagemm_TRINITY_DN9923_c0_g1::TRINITY_DN9923_c0_g1_i1::g.3391::m.3391 type:complete len:113 gc:universal TRINITY_DN9923_c0_g1_i1:200-538(+)